MIGEIKMTAEQIILLISIINIFLIDVVIFTTFIVCKIFDYEQKKLENLKKEEENEQKTK